jgi:hypothetical protein
LATDLFNSIHGGRQGRRPTTYSNGSGNGSAAPVPKAAYGRRPRLPGRGRNLRLLAIEGGFSSAHAYQIDQIASSENVGLIRQVIAGLISVNAAATALRSQPDRDQQAERRVREFRALPSDRQELLLSLNRA